MAKMTKSLLILKERNCSVSIVLDARTNRKNVTEFPLSLRFTVDRKFFYYHVSGSYTEKQFSDICNANRSTSDNYKEQKKWLDSYVPKYKALLQSLNPHSPLTYEQVHQAVVLGNTNLDKKEDNRTFFSIWEEIIYELKTDDDGRRCTTAESYQSALRSFYKIMGKDSVKGFNISAAEIQKWKDGMQNGVKGKKGKLVGKISDSTAGIYLRACRAVWNRCVREGYLLDVPYPFSNKREKGLVSIPVAAKRKKMYLNVTQMTELYNLFLSKNYPDTWEEVYRENAHRSLGLFLVQYLCNGFNLADAARLTYDSYYYQTSGKAFRFNRKKTARTSQDGSEVIVPIIEPLRIILDEIAAKPTRNGFVFPYILNGAESEADRRKRTQQENSNITDRMRKICVEALHWDESLNVSNTWARHSFATNMRNAGFEMDYISESMGHSTSDHAITQIYIEHYPLEVQLKNNMKLLHLDEDAGESDERALLLAQLSGLSDEKLRQLAMLLK